METLQRALEPYRHLDPPGWVGLHVYLPVWAGLVCIAVGLLMALWGGGRLFRVVAGPLGAIIGTVWVGTLAGRLGFEAQKVQIAMVATFALAGIGLLFPPGVVFFAFGIPVGLITGELAGETDWLVGFAPGFLVGGAVGVVLHRVVGAVLSSVLGAWAIVMGLMAALRPFTEAVKTLADAPIVALGVAGLFAIGGTVFQLFLAPSPEERAEAKAQKAQDKLRAKERKAVEARWAKYGGRPKDD